MQSNSSTLSLSRTVTPAHQAIGAGVAAPVASADLLQGQKTVGILHNGALYRLQATKLGKLILTK